MPSNRWLSLGKDAASVVAAFAPVPGLSMGVDALCSLITLCEEVSVYRNETRELCNRCHNLLLAVVKYQPPPPNTLQAAFDDVTKCITNIKNRVEKWAHLSWLCSLFKLERIKDDLKKSRVEIEDCFRQFQLASTADTSRWQAEFADKQDQMMTILQERLQKSSKKQLVELSQNLHELQVKEKTLLPNPQLVLGREITDIEEQAVSGTASIEIYRGRYLQKETVAIKVLRLVSVDEDTKRRFRREAEIWNSIYKIDNGEYILPFYGFGQGEDLRPFIISPWQENGNALSYVQKNDATVNYKQMIINIAKGLKVLHVSMTPPVVHGDIRAENIFIDSKGNPLIGDFGLSKMVQDMTNTPFTQSDGVAALYRWFAPEMCLGEGLMSPASDIYSFGMTVLELLTHQHPYSKIKRGYEVVEHVRSGRPPPKPKETRVVERGLDDKMWELLVECWNRTPSARPEIEEILKRLESL
ncbi:hypothetical protein E1B28_002041 [Marasmius oreades]|uniref:Protein kinase domain-containing protein n=1 Tax=Marasmius oreades TaxID=181124 RepID=A0A9P7V4Q7_9AGAR|nr:uncharacterized protein E1B28_002041 [Marasmius oreades]KAG7100268.1 hypothetical protein E1B28_002041 [Marasmius oreades]